MKTMNETEIARDFTSRFLTELEIKRVIFVDDDFSIPNEDIIESLIGSSKYREKLPFQIDGDLWEAPEEVLRGTLNEQISKLGETERNKLQDIFKLPLAPDLTPLEEVFSNGGVTLELLTLTEWRAHYGTDPKRTITEKCVVLFDQSFLKEGGNENTGLTEVAQLKDLENICSGIVTNNCAPGKELDEWKRISGTYGLVPHRFLYISKERLKSDLLGFARMLKLVAVGPLCHTCLDMVTEIAANATSNAVTRCKSEVNVFDFEHAVFALSRTEGAWEPDSILRILFIYLRQEVGAKLRGDSGLLKVVENVRRLAEIEIDDGSDVKHESWRIQQLEIYEEGDILNQLLFPIELGDVFQIEATQDAPEKTYVLIAQPCDLMVRSNGKRDGRSAEEAVLCEIRAQKYSEDQTFPLPYWNKDDGASAYVNVAARRTIDPKVLDLAAFHKEGKCIFARGNDCPEQVTPSWIKRHGIVHRYFEQKFDDFKKISQANLVNQDKLRKTYLSASIDQKLVATADLQEEKIDYKLRRIRRIRHPWAQVLLQQFASNYARYAYEMDFGRGPQRPTERVIPTAVVDT